MMTIVPFEPKYAKDFATLNLQWLEKYFVVEPHDADLLERCQETIIDRGGYIFFGKIANEVVGTFALLKVDNETYELGKMTISPKYQGQRLGQQLLIHCINYAKANSWKTISLYSSIRLENALHIYKKYGFVEVPFRDSPYNRGDIKMELYL